MLKMGILGLGGIARKMADTVMKMENVKLAAVGSRSMEKAKAFAGEYGVEKSYGSYEELVSDEEPDLIYIATPHSEHYKYIKLCLEHGKNVLCEKAFTLNAEQAGEVLSMAEERGLLLTEAIWTRYMPSRKLIDDAIDSGIIGTPLSLTANLGYELSRVQRLMDPVLGGGALLDVGVYTINFAMMVFGEDYADIVSKATFNEKGADMYDSVTITWPDGKMAVLHASALSQTDRRGIIYGSRGYMEVENINNCEAIRIYDLKQNLVQTITVPEQITGYEYEVEACRLAIEEGRKECPEMPHKSTLKVMKTMDEIRRQWNYKYPCEQ